MLRKHKSIFKRPFSVKSAVKDLQATLLNDLKRVFEDKGLFNDKEGIIPTEVVEINKNTVETSADVDSVFFCTSGYNVNYTKAADAIEDWIATMQSYANEDLDSDSSSYEETELEYMYDMDNNHGYYIELKAEVSPVKDFKSKAFRTGMPVDTEMCRISLSMRLRASDNPNSYVDFPKESLIIRKKKDSEIYRVGNIDAPKYTSYWDLFDFITSYTKTMI